MSAVGDVLISGCHRMSAVVGVLISIEVMPTSALRPSSGEDIRSACVGKFGGWLHPMQYVQIRG
jgi:hypothetical protein